MKNFLKKIGAGAFALVMLALSMPAEAQCVPGGVCVVGNRLRFELDRMMEFDDLKASVKNSLEYLGYGDLLYSQNDPSVITADNDARCPNKAKQTLAGLTTANTSDPQKVAAAQALINQFKGPPSGGGLGNALPARSGIPAQPSGWSSMVSGMPKDANGFRIMSLVFGDGSSIGVKLTIPGGSGGDPAGATIVSSNPLSFIRTPAQTAPGQTDKAACPW